MRLWHHPLNENDIQQILRTATGVTIGFIFCKFFNLGFGAFFVIMPVMLLGLIPSFNEHIIKQVIASGVVCGLEVGIVNGYLSSHPIVMTIIVALLFMGKFYCMASGPLFLFGSSCIISLSIMLHYSSYPDTDVSNLIVLNFSANIISIIIAYIMHKIFPDVEPRQPPPKPKNRKPSHQIRHEVLLGTSVATLSFVVFQCLDLKGSLSAQSTSILLLFPMHWDGALSYSKKRATGAFFGVTYGLFFQFLLYNHSGELLLIIPVVFIGAMIFCYCHLKEGIGSGVGFGGMTTLALLFGQYLTPTGDLTYSALYRVSSILFSIITTLSVIYITHRILNNFKTTHYGR